MKQLEKIELENDKYIFVEEEIEVFDLIGKINEFEDKNLKNSLRKHYLGFINEFDIFSVNADYVRLHYDMNFCDFGNGYRYDFIPKNDRGGCELWGDDELDRSEYAPDILHEINESIEMRDEGKDYDLAHSDSNIIEKPYRIDRDK